MSDVDYTEYAQAIRDAYELGYSDGLTTGYATGYQNIDKGITAFTATAVQVAQVAQARRTRAAALPPPKTPEQIRAESAHSWRRFERTAVAS